MKGNNVETYSVFDKVTETLVLNLTNVDNSKDDIAGSNFTDTPVLTLVERVDNSNISGIPNNV